MDAWTCVFTHFEDLPSLSRPAMNLNGGDALTLTYNLRMEKSPFTTLEHEEHRQNSIVERSDVKKLNSSSRETFSYVRGHGRALRHMPPKPLCPGQDLPLSCQDRSRSIYQVLKRPCLTTHPTLPLSASQKWMIAFPESQEEASNKF